LFCWCRHVWKATWVLGKKKLIDKQTCKTQGRSEYKTRCGKYKRLGDDIQADCIADDGFTYNFYFRNKPPDRTWTDQGFCPIHSRLLHMFQNLTESGTNVKWKIYLTP